MVHFAGLKAVGESVVHPFLYFENNLIGSITLYSVMAKYSCKKACLSIYVLFLMYESMKYIMHSGRGKFESIMFMIFATLYV